MIDQPVPLPGFPDLLDWRSLNTTPTQLAPEHIQQAVSLSRSIYLSDQRWQVYLSALGVLGFEQWLGERDPDLMVQQNSQSQSGASIWQPSLANLLSVGCNIQVGAFKVCLITVGSLLDDQVNVPIAALNLPDFAAHFYVLMQVLEEEEQVAVTGFFTYEHYRQHQTSLHIDRDWTYALPFDWFNLDPQALLLNLRCLQPDSIRLAAMDVTQPSVALRQKLASLRSQFYQQPAWEILTVEEGMTLLSNPDLVNSLYVSPPPQAINVGLWLRNQIDSVAQELGWQLMPSPAMRSLREDFDTIRLSLEQQGVQIPPSARGAYRVLRSQQTSLRLYALTWLLSESSEWMLLIALGG
ncbi:MAG: DUF1822 family protein [Leptolyngbyaceae cyanobacterium SU_3_3]|nr:DUF1822 family protein [Leptolyngbyaceae cyanobacterium SU_3_3]